MPRSSCSVTAALTLILLLFAWPAHAEQSDATSSASSASSTEGADATSAASETGAGAPALDLYDILLGPAFATAWVLFVVGFGWRLLEFRRFTRRRRKSGVRAAIAARAPVPDDAAFLSGGMSWFGRLFSRYRRWERGTVFAASPVMARVSLVFHVLLFLLPLALPAHNRLLLEGIGVSFPSLPTPLMDTLTLLLLGFGGFFLLRRIFFPRVRVLSTVRDYLILLLVTAPFVTAYAAYHRWFDYHTLLVAHMIVGEILIAAIPFTKLGHMPFLIFARFFTASEHSWKPAGRRW